MIVRSGAFLSEGDFEIARKLNLFLQLNDVEKERLDILCKKENAIFLGPTGVYNAIAREQGLPDRKSGYLVLPNRELIYESE